MKVPTYHKYGLTKARVNKSELRDKKISDILTHYLTISIGIVLGILIYILNYRAVQPSNFIQAIGQIFLFASMGVICVGIPAVLFKLAEMFYFRYVSSRSEEKKNIKKYYEDRHHYDFWKIRHDYSFWRVLDGLSFEREVINIFLHLGYSVNQEELPEVNQNDRIVTSDNETAYLSFCTSKEISDPAYLEGIINCASKFGIDRICVISQRGFGKKALDFAEEHNIQLYEINELIKLVKTIKSESNLQQM